MVMALARRGVLGKKRGGVSSAGGRERKTPVPKWSPAAREGGGKRTEKTCI